MNLLPRFSLVKIQRAMRKVFLAAALLALAAIGYVVVALVKPERF